MSDVTNGTRIIIKLSAEVVGVMFKRKCRSCSRKGQVLHKKLQPLVLIIICSGLGIIMPLICVRYYKGHENYYENVGFSVGVMFRRDCSGVIAY